MSVVFFTGYPGFLGSELLPRILERRSDAVAHCLVQPKFAALARERAAAFGERVRIIEGDITSRINAEPEDVVEIWHLAAVYDISVSESVGLAVNVDGTKHVLDFAERCGALERLHYVSTCYVSGRYEGRRDARPCECISSETAKPVTPTSTSNERRPPIRVAPLHALRVPRDAAPLE